jgi:hypothetical protein
MGGWLREGRVIPISRGGFGLPMIFSSLENDLTDSEDDLGDKENMD